MGILAWLVIGGLAGWVASIIMGKNAQFGVIGNVVIGVVGAFLGGFIFSFINKASFTGFNLTSFLVALAGAVVLLFVMKLFKK